MFILYSKVPSLSQSTSSNTTENNEPQNLSSLLKACTEDCSSSLSTFSRICPHTKGLILGVPPPPPSTPTLVSFLSVRGDINCQIVEQTRAIPIVTVSEVGVPGLGTEEAMAWL